MHHTDIIKEVNGHCKPNFIAIAKIRGGPLDLSKRLQFIKKIKDVLVTVSDNLSTGVYEQVDIEKKAPTERKHFNQELLESTAILFKSFQ